MDNQANINAANAAFQQAAAQAATEANAQSVRTPPPVFARAGNGKGPGTAMKVASWTSTAIIIGCAWYGAYCIGQLIGEKIRG